MSNALTTADRVVLLLALVPYLVERGPTPLNELAEAFAVDPRVLRQLIPFLGMAGIPGETNTYQHEDLFDLDWDAFEEHEIVSLTRVVAVDDTPRFSSAESAALLAGLQSLLPLLPAAEQRTARSAMGKLAAVGPEQPSAPQISVTPDPGAPSHAIITEAIEAGRRLEFEYCDTRGRDSARRVDPLLLVQAHGIWYLRGWCLDRAAERTFAVDRMRSVRVSPERAAAGSPDRVPPASIVPEVREITALLRIRVGALHRLAGFVPRVLGQAENGWLRAEVELTHAAAAIRLVQEAPGEVVVETPASARAAVREWAERALAPHDA